MKARHLLMAATALAVLCAPAQAQLGGLKPKLPGSGGSESSAPVNAADIDTYLAQATENADLLLFSFLLLKQAQKGKVDIAGLAAQRKDIRGTPDPKERGAKMSALIKSEDNSAKLTEQEAANLQKTIASQTPAVQAQIGAALINLAIAIPRAIDLTKEAPNLIKGLGASPSAFGNIGKIKTAAGLIGDQVKYTVDIVPMLPGLMTAAKVKPVKDAKTSKGVPIPGLM